MSSTPRIPGTPRRRGRWKRSSPVSISKARPGCWSSTRWTGTPTPRGRWRTARVESPSRRRRAKDSRSCSPAAKRSSGGAGACRRRVRSPSSCGRAAGDVALLLLGPGVLLHALFARRRRAVELPLLAAAFWIVAFWWIRPLPWDWAGPIAAAVWRWRGTALGLAVGVGAVLVARAPLHFWTWGGAPNALGIAFGVAGFAAGLDAVRRSDVRSAAACALYAAAGLLTHAVTIVAFAYCAALMLAGALLRDRSLLRGFGVLLAAGAFAALLCAPYLETLKPIDPSGAPWIRSWLRQSATLGLLPRMLHDVPLIAGVAALVAVLARAPQKALLPALLAALLAGLVLQGRHGLLPGSALLYPDRIAVLLLYPIALLAHDALDSRPRVAAAVALLLLVHAGILQRKLLREGRAHALATEADLRVIAAARLPEGCWVMNNYGDAGQWIPALIGRPITFPHIHVAFFGVEQRVHPCAAFRGEKRPYHADTVVCPGPGCEAVLRDGGAELFRIVDPALSVEMSAQR